MRAPLPPVLLYARTLRHLTPGQVVYQALRRVQRYTPLPRTAPPEGVDAANEAAMAAAVAAWGPGDAEARIRAADEVVAGTFRFLNHPEALPRVDWHRRQVSHLWSYNLHYFAYGVDLAWAFRLTSQTRYLERFTALALDWARATASGRGDAWEPYTVSMRVSNWVHALLLLGPAVPRPVRDELMASLHRQAGVLEHRLERHLLGNHLLRNLSALSWAGLLFGGPVALRWRRRGLAGAWREMLEQVGPDGVHFERAPLYHRLVLGDMLELLSLARACGADPGVQVAERVRAMVLAAGALTRTDGALHLFGDSAEGVALPLEHLSGMGERIAGTPALPPTGAFALPDSGFYGWRQGRNAVLLRCGEAGAAYQPGHAHCDLLSFEMELDGRAVVVDSGVAGYGGDPLREYVRSTRAHSTVGIDGREQSEVWGVFRMARRAVALAAEGMEEEGGYVFRGAVRPFHTRAVHHRELRMGPEGCRVTDRVEGARGSLVQSWVHLHPAFELRADGEGEFRAVSPGMELRIRVFGAQTTALHRGERDPAQGWYAAEFGRAVPAPVLELRVPANDGRHFGYEITRMRGDA